MRTSRTSERATDQGTTCTCAGVVVGWENATYRAGASMHRSLGAKRFPVLKMYGLGQLLPSKRAVGTAAIKGPRLPRVGLSAFVGRATVGGGVPRWTNITHTRSAAGPHSNSSLARTRSLVGPMRPTVHLAGTEMRALLALRCVIGNDLFQAPEEMGSPESCRPKTSCAPNPTGVPVTGPNDGGVKCIGKSEFFNHVYKVMIDFIDVGKASAQNDDVRV
jgi:hypothetical protein